MAARELFVLGTASQVPTRHRNHNGYFLRWDDEGILFDPGEGTQRQMILAGLSASSITRICVTHFHGDHCLGLPGIIQRLSLDNVEHPVTVHYPASGQAYFDRLRRASIYAGFETLKPAPITSEGPVHAGGDFTIEARRLDHEADCFGYRIEEPVQTRFVQDRLDAAGLRGPLVGKLLREGRVEHAGRTVLLSEVSERQAGNVFAFVMDTRPCEGARRLAASADLLVCESTYLDVDADLAARGGHLTAAQAATLARDAGAQRLVIGHFSQRYLDARPLLREARGIHADVVAAREPAWDVEDDRHRIPVPARRPAV